MRLKFVLTGGIMVMLAAVLVSCGKLDVVGNGSIGAFDQLLQRLPAEGDGGGWVINAPDGGARFFWSGDYSSSSRYDVMIEFDAAPFIVAGLDVEKLPSNYFYSNGWIATGVKFDGKGVKSSGEAGPLAAYKQIVRLNRQVIGYHAALDHYGVNLGGGNLFEWAKDMGANDKDMVFVLDPAPLAAAGLNPNVVDGWLFAPVTVDDENGRPVQVDKLLKPFDLPPPPPAGFSPLRGSIP
ncbi:MAG: hypothetical protein LBJ35_05675 [Spirochaetaceae bacterium]|jgi:hypothetical protein|nr:hypothetical protein [Spirochaetaceae bacterium]